jgi:type II secretory pathway component GspD/PulD (secretin)
MRALFFSLILLTIVSPLDAQTVDDRNEAPWKVAPLIDPEDRAKEVRRLEALPIATTVANGANGSTLGDTLETLAVSANLSYIGLTDPQLRDLPVTFRIYDNPWGTLKTLSLSYNFDMVYAQVTKGRAVWKFTPLHPDELISRTYVLKHNTHEVTTGSGSSSDMGSLNGTNSSSQSIGSQRNTAGNASGSDGGSGTSFNSDNPLTAQIREYLQVNDKTGTPQGFVKWIPDSNVFLVKATAKQHRDIEDFLAVVDQPLPEITLDFAFVLASATPSQKDGVDWSIYDQGLPISLSGLSTSVDLNHPSNLRAPSSAMLSTADLSAKLNLFRSNQNSFSVITGSQTVLSNREAQLDSVQELPIQQNTLASVGNAGATGGVATGTVDFKDVGTIVRAKGKVLAGGGIQLTLDIQVSSVVDFMNVGGQQVPVTAKQKYNTSVIVNEGMSLAMGGLESSVKSESIKKFPVLGDIPFFGFPFRSIAKDATRTRLLLFVTPHVLPDYKGGNFAGNQSVTPVTRKSARIVFNARPGLTIGDVNASLDGFNDDITPLETFVRAGRADATVKRAADLLRNELDLIIVTLDENRLQGINQADVRERVQLYRSRVVAVAKRSTDTAL